MHFLYRGKKVNLVNDLLKKENTFKRKYSNNTFQSNLQKAKENPCIYEESSQYSDMLSTSFTNQQ